MLAEEQGRLHRLPDVAFTAAFGETRKVSWSSTISFGGVTYSVPHQLVDAEVWVRVDGDEVVATHVGPPGAVEVARHLRSTPGTPRIDDAHYPPRPAGPLNRQPRATNTAEAEFLALGDGARMWLLEAASAGTARVKVKMADAVMLARLHGEERVDWALGHAATYGRFADGDVASILAAHPRHAAGDTTRCRAAPAWDGFGASSERRSGPWLDAAMPRPTSCCSCQRWLRRLPPSAPPRTSPTSTPSTTSPVQLPVGGDDLDDDSPAPSPRPTRSSSCSAARLPHMRRHAPDVLATAKAQRWEPAEAVRALLAEELAGRQASSINTRRAAAGFPTGKTFDTWDEQVSSIPAPTQRSLATLEWIDRHENLVVCGPSGTGKTHLLEALGHAAIGHGCHVQWFSLEALGMLVHRHRADGTTTRAIRKLIRADLICVDDIGLLPVGNDTAEALYRVVDAAYEKRSSRCPPTSIPPGSTS